MTASLPDTKHCSGCDTDKPLEEFYRHPHGKYGRDPQCRRCKNRRHPTRRRIANRRARQRATAELMQLHKDEFDQLRDKHLEYVLDEMEILAQAAEAQRDDDTKLPRLKPGPRRGDEEIEDRLGEARCTVCATYHDRGHDCPTCAVARARQTLPPLADIDEVVDADRRTEECGRCGRWEPGQVLSPRLLCDQCEARPGLVAV